MPTFQSKPRQHRHAPGLCHQIPRCKGCLLSGYLCLCVLYGPKNANRNAMLTPNIRACWSVLALYKSGQGSPSPGEAGGWLISRVNWTFVLGHWLVWFVCPSFEFVPGTSRTPQGNTGATQRRRVDVTDSCNGM